MSPLLLNRVFNTSVSVRYNYVIKQLQISNWAFVVILSDCMPVFCYSAFKRPKKVLPLSSQSTGHFSKYLRLFSLHEMTPLLGLSGVKLIWNKLVVEHKPRAR